MRSHTSLSSPSETGTLERVRKNWPTAVRLVGTVAVNSVVVKTVHDVFPDSYWHLMAGGGTAAISVAYLATIRRQDRAHEQIVAIQERFAAERGSIQQELDELRQRVAQLEHPHPET